MVGLGIFLHLIKQRRKIWEFWLQFRVYRNVKAFIQLTHTGVLVPVSASIRAPLATSTLICTSRAAKISVSNLSFILANL